MDADEGSPAGGLCSNELDGVVSLRGSPLTGRQAWPCLAPGAPGPLIFLSLSARKEAARGSFPSACALFSTPHRAKTAYLKRGGRVKTSLSVSEPTYLRLRHACYTCEVG